MTSFLDQARTDHVGNLPPTGADLARLKAEFVRHADCAGIAEIRAEMLRQHFAGDLDQRTVLNIIDWLQDGCDEQPENEAPAAAQTPREERPLHKGEIVTNAAGQIVRLYLSKTGNLYGKVRNAYGEWEYESGAMRGARHLTADEAAAYGKSTEHCVFCGRGLSDDRTGCSLEVGYGPVCADKYGLPWGSK